MAVTDHEPDIMAFKPKWPDLADVQREGRFRFIYNALSDTMFIPFYDPIEPAASVPVNQGEMDYVFLRVNMETQEVIGFQVEHFLSYAVGQMTDLINALELADLHGITRDEVAETKRRGQPERGERVDAAALLEN